MPSGTVVRYPENADLPAIDQRWCALFPDPADRPARQVMQLGLQRRSRAQFHLLAASSA